MNVRYICGLLEDNLEWYFRAAFCYPPTMQITVQLPDDLAQHPNPAREALEAFAIEGYRSGALSAHQTRLLLGFETGFELDGFLKEHGVWNHAYSVEDLEKDAAGFERHA
jgi:predicted HTH domain antitoxin